MLLGPRVVRAIQQARHKRILLARLGVVQHSRQLPDDGVEQRHRRDFASRENEIPDRNLLVDAAVDQPLVNPS
jgi:hypothetical protein